MARSAWLSGRPPATTTLSSASLRASTATQRPGTSLAVLGCEVFGRWNSDAVSLLDELAALKANDAPPLLRRSARLAWSNRWWGLVGVATHRAIAESLLCEGGADLLPGAGGGECPPLADVLGPAH